MIATLQLYLSPASPFNFLKLSPCPKRNQRIGPQVRFIHRIFGDSKGFDSHPPRDTSEKPNDKKAYLQKARRIQVKMRGQSRQGKKTLLPVQTPGEGLDCKQSQEVFHRLVQIMVTAGPEKRTAKEKTGKHPI